MSENQLFDTLMGRINDKLAAPVSTLYNFFSSYMNGHNPNSQMSDKENHAYANCKSAQYYDVAPTMMLDYGREAWDMLRKNTWDKRPNTTLKDVVKDSNRDIEADNYGFMQGLLNPLGDCNQLLDREYLRNLNK